MSSRFGGRDTRIDDEGVVYYLAFGSNLNRARMSERIGDVGGMVFIDRSHSSPAATLAATDGAAGAALTPAAREVGDDLDSPQSKVSPQPAAVVLHSWYLTFNKRAGGAPGRGYATLEKTPARPGDPPAEAVLWPTTMAGIRMLDAFEGEGTHYKRELWEVAVGDESRQAWVYLHCDAFYEPGSRPDREYLHHLLAGEGEGLSPGYVGWLKAQPRHEYQFLALPKELTIAALVGTTDQVDDVGVAAAERPAGDHAAGPWHVVAIPTPLLNTVVRAHRGSATTVTVCLAGADEGSSGAAAGAAGGPDGGCPAWRLLSVTALRAAKASAM